MTPQPAQPQPAPALAARGADRFGDAGAGARPQRRLGGGILLLLMIIVASGVFWLWHQSPLDPLVARLQSELHGAVADRDSDAAMVLEIKQLLGQLDFPPGPADGRVDPATEAAIRSYQEIAGMPVDGKPSRALLQNLRAVVADQQRGGS
jgi:hypothetical protein